MRCRRKSVSLITIESIRFFLQLNMVNPNLRRKLGLVNTQIGF